MDDKETLVKKLTESKQEVYELVKKINTFDGIKILLSFMESLHDELIQEVYQLETKNLQNNTLHLAMIDSTSSNIAIIQELLPLILLFSNLEKNELIRTHTIITTLATDEHASEVQNWIAKQFDENNDTMFTMSMQLLEGSFRAKRFILIKDYQINSRNNQLPLIIDLMRKYSTLRSIPSILRQKISARVTSEGKISFNEPDPQYALERKKLHPRKFATQESFPFWKKNISDTTKEGLLSTKLSRDAPKQRTIQDLEHNQFFDEFIKLPEISKNFEKRFDISLTNFRDITLAIKRVSLSSTTSVVSLPKPRLISKIKKLSKCSKSEIVKVLDMFILKKGDPIYGKYIFKNGLECIYSWSLITFPLDNMMTELYDKWIDGNKKGIDFEIDCRNILQSQSCLVLNDRLLLPPLNTDLDVVCSKGNVLFIIECKAEARRSIRESSQTHQFENYYEKLLFKSQWISKNFKHFSEFLNKNKFDPKEKIEFIVPLLVTRIQQLDSSNILTLSLDELREVISKIDTIKNDFLEISLDSGVTLQIPILSVNHSENILDML